MAKNNTQSLLISKKDSDVRPSHTINPREKDKNWILQNVKSIYKDFGRNYPNTFYNGRQRYDTVLSFVQGLQSPRKYQERYDQNKTVTQKKTSINHDKNSINIINKYFRLMYNSLGDVDFDITATPNNSLARDHEDEYRNKLETLMEMKKIAEDGGYDNVLAIAGQQGIEIPSDMEELELQMQMSEPARLSMEVEQGISWLNYLDDSDNKFREGDFYLLVFGACGAHAKVDINGISRTEDVIDPRDLLVGYSAKQDFRDISEVGEFRMATINDIRKEAGGDLSKDDIEIISKNFEGKYNNGYVNDRHQYNEGTGESLYANQRVLLLDVYFYSYDEVKKEIVIDKKGNKKIYDRQVYKKNKKGKIYKKKDNGKDVYITRTKNVYKATWVVNSDYIYNAGLLRPTERTRSNPNDTKLPIQIVAPLMQDNNTQSIIEQMIPIEKQINVSWQKMQEAKAHARPPGFQINVDALKQAIEGFAGDWKNEKEVLDLVIKHNIMPFAMQGLDGVANGAKPFIPDEGGLGSNYDGWWRDIQNQMILMQEISGFANVAAGSADIKYTGKKVAEDAAATANLSIRHLFEAKINLYQRHMQSKVNLAMDSISKGNMFGYRRSFGKRTIEMIRVNKKAGLYDYNIKIEFRPNREQWAKLERRIEIALSQPLDQGGIGADDAFMIENCENLKQAEALLSLKVKKNRKEAREQAMLMQQEKSQLDQESAIVASDKRLEAIQEEITLKSQLLEIESNLKRLERSEDFQFELELKKLEGLVKGDHIEKKGTIDELLTKIKADANMDRMKSKVPAQVGGRS